MPRMPWSHSTESADRMPRVPTDQNQPVAGSWAMHGGPSRTMT